MTLTGTPNNNDENSQYFDKAQNRLSSDSSKGVSHGRGGAGNIGVSENDQEKENGSLPHIKQSVYTTARGGTGNMQKNDFEHPEIARASQDVEMTPRRPSQTDYHGGRGGSGNIFSPSEDELSHHSSGAPASDYSRTGGLGLSKKADKGPVNHGDTDYRGWADKGKDVIMRFSRRK